MSHHNILPAVSGINQPAFLTASTYKDVAVLRKKAHAFAEDIRSMLLQGVVRKEPTKAIDRKFVRSSFEISEPFQIKKSQVPHRFHLTKPRSVLPAVGSSDQTLTGTNETVRNTCKSNEELDQDNIGKRRLTQSLYELDRKHCDLVQSTLDGTDPDISLSMNRFRQSSNEKNALPVLRSSVLFYTSCQKTPVVLPNLENVTSLGDEVRNVDYQIAPPEFQEFVGNKFSFYKDFSRLCEYENVHQKNLISLITRDLDTFHADNVGYISDDELLQMIHSLIIHIGDKKLLNDEITKDLLGVYEHGISSAPNQRELALQLRLCIKKLPRTESIPLKAIIGHIRRIAIVYGYYKSIRSLCGVFSELLFTTDGINQELLDASPSELYDIIFKRNGPQTQLSAVLELMLYHYNIFF